jgi:hypothetical protein
MITYIENLPGNMVGFKATGEVDERDFTEVVMPKVKELVERTNNLNYMLVLDTSITNFSLGAWFKDVVLGIKYITKWNRAAIVTDTQGIITFTEMFSILSPGEFKGFEHKDLQAAIDWCSEKNDQQKSD